ncbi:MAG: hypothetical protein H7Y05_15090 [Steroidobacteraceae bacterium]|nr:hypothetical protein [Deltaproteobacteria bacterium]
MNDLKSTEDYKFLAELTWGGTCRTLYAPCKIFLPKKVRERPRLVFYPDTDTFRLLIYAKDCELRGSLGNGPGSITTKASDVRLGDGNQRRWGDGLDEGYILGYPKQLLIDRNMGQDVGNKSASFYFTESLLLSPFDLLTQKYDGTVEVEHVSKVQFRLNANCLLSFEYEYRYDSGGSSETRSWRELVARTDLDLLPAGISPEDLLPHIDDFLLLVSLAEGRRCACLEVVWSQQDQLLHLFRLDRTIPEERANHSINDCLIVNIKEELEPFLKKSYDTLRNFPEKNLLWSALASITWFKQSTIGDDFLRLFTALETLVLAFRRINGLELAVQDDAIRNEIQKDVKKFLHGHHLLKDGTNSSRGMLYENIPGLFHISLKRATEAFVETYKIRLDDVWPLFDTSTGWSLLNIRNKIVHGEHFSEGEWFDLMEAKMSLRVIAERFLLSMLGWDYQKTRVHWGNSATEGWKAAQTRLSEQAGGKEEGLQISDLPQG